MIVPMKKAVLVTIESRKAISLEKLKHFGILHLEELKGEGERLEELRNTRDMVERAVYSLSPDSEESGSGPASYEAALELARRVNRQLEKAREIQDELEKIGREKEKLSPWGDFDPDIIRDLAKSGIKLRLFQLSAAQAAKIDSKIRWFSIKSTKTERYAVIVDDESFKAIDSSEWKEFPLPEKSLQELGKLTEERSSQLEHIRQELDHLAASRPRLLLLKDEIDDQIEFENVLTGMDRDESIVYLQGFLPEERCKELKEMTAANGIGLIIRDPSPEDRVPTLIKNPKSVSIIQPVFDMLGTVPGYHERDISIFFLVFLSIFFAMIIGDAGYGLIFFVPAILGIRSGKKKRGEAPPAMVLLAVMGFATIVWGTITGTWFGSEYLANLPPLKALTIPHLASFGDKESSELIKFICFVLGTVHLSIAHLWNFIKELKKRPVIRAFAQLGWLSMVLGLYYLVLNLVISADQYPLPVYSMYMIFGGLAAVFIFGEQEGNFFKGVGKGVAGVLPTFLSSISAFSDIISYIRLFAVGLASVEIAKSFNSMASGLGNDVVGIIGAVLILLLGHSLNLAMGALSVVVHGVRLNMLEFSGHLGMEWTGVEYYPFRNKERK
jgi:V/A-type H+/Na+-transporting ATPase subunit I